MLDRVMPRAGKGRNLTTMAIPHIELKIHMKEFELWSRTLRTKDIKRAKMRALRQAGFKVMKAEQREVRRVFRKRPTTGGFVSRAIRYEAFPRLEQVWVGPFRSLKGKTGGTGRVGANAAPIIADHIEGSTYTSPSIRPRALNATRLRTPTMVAIPLPAFAATRGTTGLLKFSSVRKGLNKSMVLGDARPEKQAGPTKSFKMDIDYPKAKSVIAVRPNKPLATPKGSWGFPMESSGARKGKRAISVKHKYVIPLFFLKSRAKVKSRIQFYRVAMRVAPRALAEAFRHEFHKDLKGSKSLGITPTKLM